MTTRINKFNTQPFHEGRLRTEHNLCLAFVMFLVGHMIDFILLDKVCGGKPIYQCDASFRRRAFNHGKAILAYALYGNYMKKIALWLFLNAIAIAVAIWFEDRCA